MKKALTEEQEEAIIVLLKRLASEIRHKVRPPLSSLQWQRVVNDSINRTLHWLDSLEEEEEVTPAHNSISHSNESFDRRQTKH